MMKKKFEYNEKREMILQKKDFMIPKLIGMIKLKISNSKSINS